MAGNARKIRVFDGERANYFLPVNRVYGRNTEYLFTAYGEDGSYWKCYENKKAAKEKLSRFCVRAVPREGKFRNMELLRKCGMAMNCRFHVGGM